MKVFYREFVGVGRPLIIIHGLFGSSKNWITNAKELSKFAHVYAIDVRNHGESAHSSSHLIGDLVADLKEFILEHNLEHPILLGHSMGGLNALLFALTYPEMIHSLVVLDIAPRSYEINYEAEFKALSMDVSHFESRQAIDEEMKKVLPDSFIRQFLQMNLDKLDIGYKWKLNVDTLKNARTALNLDLVDTMHFAKKTLFVLGGESEYIKPEDKSLIRKFFSNSRIETIQGAGHYLHYTHSKEFLQIASSFIRGL
jgi:pimeloyl-ACP methyl ester carboxylesterase